MKQPLEISWLGGAVGKHFRRIRPGILDLPWGTLDPRRYPPHLVERSRALWTRMAYNEFATAAYFAEALRLLLASRAPIDLVAMAGDFIADEAAHAEIVSRLVAELGGATPLEVDYAALAPKVNPSLTPFQQANEVILRLSCVAEAFSAHIAAGSVRVPSHPLIRGVYETIARDESLHGRIGCLYLEWACDEMDDAERRRLATIALSALRSFTAFWRPVNPPPKGSATRERHTIAEVNALGWTEAGAFATRARHAVRAGVVAPLARVGIEIDEGDIEALLA